MAKFLRAIAAGSSLSFFLFFVGCGAGSVDTIAPVVSQVVPKTILAGSQTLTMTVSGTNFSSDTVILWNGAPLQTALVDSNTLAGTVTRSSIAQPSTAQVQVQNKANDRKSSLFPISIFAPSSNSSSLAIASQSLPQATVGTSYSATLTATGGTPSYTWNVASGNLPSGLSLARQTGIITGTPTASGSYSFDIIATDSSVPTNTSNATFTISVAAAALPGAPLSITTSSLPSATHGQSYSNALQTSGGIAPYSWSITSGSLPAGLSLANGVISGTPTASGNFSIAVKATDSSSPAQTASATLALSVAAATSALSITTTSLAAGTTNQPYSASLNATGGGAPYSWSITSGSLPAGLSLANGVISGTPTASGNFSITVKATDSSSPAQTASSTLALAVAAATSALSITTTSLAAGTTNQPYSASLSAAGGSAPYSWSITSGSLPEGLSLANGVISGTPTASGNFSIAVKATDSSSPAQTASATLALAVAASAPALAITTSSLPSATQGASYSTALQATGGTTPYSWSITSGTLPSGLSLANGVISGTPTQAGTMSITATVSDSSTPVQTQSAKISLSVTVAPLTITSPSLAGAVVGALYSSSMVISGGTPAYTWSISNGSLPAGLTLAATTGVISGTPTTAGTSSFILSVSDNSSLVQMQSSSTSITVGTAAPGTTWFVRPDGGTRYSSGVITGQCDGQADVAYPGSGANQHCAFNDVRYLWMDGTYGNSAWVISGGDTVVIRGCAALPSQQNPDAPHCRIGWDKATGNDSQNFWCAGVNAAWGCSMPPPPSGTSTQHTRILGACAYGTYTCNPVNTYPYTSNNLTQLFGGFASGAVMYLTGSQYVDLEGLEITSHNGQCSRVGAPLYPAGCSTNVPVGDYANWGIITSNTTSNITLQDLYIHGLTTTGIGGPIGGPFTLTRVFIGFNAFAGWNFDDGRSTPDAPGSSITQSYVTMIGNGCLEQYPINNPQFPALSCWDTNSGGFGDSWSGQNTELDSFTCDHCNISYNTKDAALGPHTLLENLSVTNSLFVGNMGQEGKWGMKPNSATVFTNNLVVGNCLRMGQQLPGAAQSFDSGTGLGGSYLTGYCRAAGTAFDYFTDANSSVLFANNTFVTYSPTVFDFGCISTCNPFVLTNNIFLGYSTSLNQYPNTGQAPGLYYMDGTVVLSSANNIEYGVRNGDACSGSILCIDPLLVNEPAQGAVPPETTLDNFNFHPAVNSPAIGAGIAIPGLTTDYYGAKRPNPPTIGAVEP